MHLVLQLVSVLKLSFAVRYYLQVLQALYWKQTSYRQKGRQRTSIVRQVDKQEIYKKFL